MPPEPDANALAAALVAWRENAWPLLLQLADRLGWEVPRTEAAAREAARLGLVELTETTRRGGPVLALILSQRSIDRFKLRLVPDGRSCTRFRWASAARAETGPVVMAPQPGMVALRPSLHDRGDRRRADEEFTLSSLPPAAHLIDAEEGHGPIGRHVLLVGSSTPLSPTALTPCPGCSGRPLRTVEVCLHCLRSGIDDRLPTLAEAEAERLAEEARAGAEEEAEARAKEAEAKVRRAEKARARRAATPRVPRKRGRPVKAST